MDKAKFIKVFDEIFKSNGFRKKGNNWFVEGTELKKLVNLQRSNFGNSYYLNFEFLINSLDSDDLWAHFYCCLTSTDKAERQRIDDLLNLDSSVDDEQRISELRFHLITDVISRFQKTNTEAELLSEFKKLPHLNTIPLSVKKHFNLLTN
jgi:hypothetical protein